ncbi:MAG: hypothetical protein EOQ56_15115 [Mesorhizobium sp.]|nr:MAG: hypothetical protein EOQ56_15115 [Mesorhizobium sp.]
MTGAAGLFQAATGHSGDMISKANSKFFLREVSPHRWRYAECWPEKGVLLLSQIALHCSRGKTMIRADVRVAKPMIRAERVIQNPPDAKSICKMPAVPKQSPALDAMSRSCR